MKKIISAVIVAAVILLNFNFAFAMNNSADVAKEFLIDISVIDSEFDIYKTYTRGEFAGLVTKVFYQDIFSKSSVKENFSDVSPEYEYFSEIAALRDLKIIKGDGFNNFYPDRQILFNDAITILINVLNYELYAESKGGYPGGYLFTAKNLGILNDVEISSYLKGSDALLLIYNSLFANEMALDNISEEFNYKVNSQNVLFERFNITEYDVVLVNDGIISDSNSGGFLEDMVAVKDVKNGNIMYFKYSSPDICSYFGYRLKIYVKYDKETETNKIINFVPDKNCVVSEINCEDIINSSSGMVEYEQDAQNGIYKKITYNPSKTQVYINGVKRIDYTNEDFVSGSGFVRFIDNNRDNSYDYILINKINYNVVADYVFADEKTVFCKLNPRNNLIFDDSAAYRIQNGMENVDIADISQNDILSVCKSEKSFNGKDLYLIYLSKDTISGKIDAVSERERVLNVSNASGSFEISVSPLYLVEKPRLFASLSLGYETTFRKDITGSIAYIDKLVSDNDNYMYVINVGKPKQFELPVIKVLTSDGNLENYNISSKVKIDNECLDGKNRSNINTSEYDEIIELLSRRNDEQIYHIRSADMAEKYNQSNTAITPRLCKVLFDSKNEIISIDTDYQNGETCDNDSLTDGSRIWRTVNYVPASSTFDGSFFLTGDTVILKVSDIDRYNKPSNLSNLLINTFEADSSLASSYSAITPAALQSKNLYDVQVYDVDEETGVAGACLIRGVDIEKDDNITGEFGVFLQITDYHDESLGAAQKLYYYSNNQIKTAVIDKETLHPWYLNIMFGGTHPTSISSDSEGNETINSTVNVEPLKKGDIIHIKLSGNKIDSIGRELNLSLINEKRQSTYRANMGSAYVFSYSLTNFAIPFDHRGSSNTTGYNATYNMELGVAKSMSGNVLALMQNYNDAAGTRYGTLNDYINGNVLVKTRYLTLPQNNLNITTIEETKCSKNGDDCSVIVREGKLSDIHLMDSYGTDGFYNASRIYIYNARGSVKSLFIVNTLSTHNK